MVSHETCRIPPARRGWAEPVLILTPTGRDASVAVTCLHAAGMRTHICHDMAEFCAALEGAAAGLLAEEALSAQALDLLHPGVAAPTGLVRRAPDAPDHPRHDRRRPCGSSCTCWGRGQRHPAGAPAHQVTLLSTLRVALRARRRQHEIRQLHAELSARSPSKLPCWRSCTRVKRRCDT